MEFDFPSVIVDLDSAEIKAGISVGDTPTVTLPTVYSKTSPSTFVFDDNIDLHPENDVYTLFNDGVLYNWEAIPDYLRYIYGKLNVTENIKEMPLVVAENAWSPLRNKSKALQIAFEELEVPIFSLLKRQICTAYSLSKPSAVVVVDIEDDVVAVTPISNGRVLGKGMVRSKYGGDFLNVFSLNYIKNQLAAGHSPDSVEDALVPRQFQSSRDSLADTFKRYQITKSLRDFKECILSSSMLKLEPSQTDIPRENQLGMAHGSGLLEAKDYELPNRYTIKGIGIDQYKLAEPLFRPYEYATALDPAKSLGVPRDAEGVGSLIFTSMKNLGGTGEMYVNLLNNIVITGSSAFIPMMEQRIIQDLRMYIQDYSISTYLAPDVIDRNADTWVGANILTSSSVGDFEHLFISKQDYEENGESYAADKFK
ncbi:DEKNAAC101217 [Brettanomyces naardenensis]|uniref:DEKNAAC101217 n=1 Tax=Brettanomyces naardenensis TaxID=13370 RepID=A0A448YH85_BRENA|nr:DEKNAAC101217 [Brettanomyces naardenensis]